MTLTDAGPLIAILDRGEEAHHKCTEALRDIVGPLVTTWPAFTEAMYLLGRSAGWPGQKALWAMVSRKLLLLADLEDHAMALLPTLLDQYRDLPMSLADASLVAASEQFKASRIFTLDGDFRVYRRSGGQAFVLIPQD